MATHENFEVRLPLFEGPFDLLLFFIERDELDIYNVPINNIIKDFMEFIHSQENLNIELSSEFILFVSTLMRIKAKMLLPRYDADADANEEDSKENLIRKLVEYKRFKEICEELHPLEDERFLQEDVGMETGGENEMTVEQGARFAKLTQHLLRRHGSRPLSRRAGDRRN